MNDPKLELRNRAHEVQLVVESGETRPVIGTSEPQDEEAKALQARVRAARHWGARNSPRQAADAGITEPLDLRSRTILAHRLPQDARRMLETGMPGHEKVPESGVVATLPLKVSK